MENTLTMVSDEPKVIVQNLRSGDRRALARTITLIENNRGDALEKAQHILEEALQYTGKAVRLGISGVPGVGKSTFIEALGVKLIDEGHKVAVLAVDPSSPTSGGSILGDKTRMEHLAGRNEAFIRPSPTGGFLGGVTRKTRESMLLCEAAGYDVILIETVGVGQSEYAVAEMVDLFIVLMLPGAGDALQGIKRGILEVADMLVINKADGEQKRQAQRARQEYKNALHLLKPKYEGIEVPVLLCSSITGEGVGEIWEKTNEYIDWLRINGILQEKRQNQHWDWFIRLTEEELLKRFWDNERVRAEGENQRDLLLRHETTPVLAARKLLEIMFPDKRKSD